jgi:3-hydroxyisobutyrate dehydrogenase-like beta-hydroxyacid dehydrogenase
MKLGFIGLGRMGSAMAANLLAAGHELTVYNRTKAKAEPLLKRGAHLAETLGDAARGEVVITMHGGIGAATRAHQEKRQEFVSAPVFGRPDAAASAKLFIVLAGRREAVVTCQPLFDVLGQRTFPIGDKPPMANLVKLSGNFLIASVIESLGEAVALVSKGGIDRVQYIDILTNTLFGGPVYKTYGELIAAERYSPAGFKAELGYKDVSLALAQPRNLKCPCRLRASPPTAFSRCLLRAAAISTSRRSPSSPSAMPAGRRRCVALNDAGHDAASCHGRNTHA